MANHKSCEKRARQTLVKTQRNKFYKTRIKNITKDVVLAVTSEDKEKATEAMKVANKYFHHCVSKGVLAKGTAARKVSRLQLKVNSI